MECLHRPINVRHSVIKTANLGLRHKTSATTTATSDDNATPTISEFTPTTAGGSDVTMDTVVEKTPSEAAVTMETSDNVDDTITVNEEATGGKGNNTTTGCQGNSTIRIPIMNNPELYHAGSVTMTTAQPATNIVGHTGYLTFATLSPRTAA